MALKGLNGLNWHSVNKYMSSQAIDDFNTFLEKLPLNTNKTVLIIVGIVWGCGAALGLYTTVKMQEFARISVEYGEEKALVPKVPAIKDNPVSPAEVTKFVDELQETYKGLEIKANASIIVVRSKSTAQFGEFREAIGHVQNGGVGWRVNIDRLCVGRECLQFPLSASLKINKVSVE